MKKKQMSYALRGAIGFGIGAVVTIPWMIPFSSIAPDYLPGLALVALGCGVGGAVGGAVLCTGHGARTRIVFGAVGFGVGILVSWALLLSLVYLYWMDYFHMRSAMITLYENKMTPFVFAFPLFYGIGGVIGGRITRRGSAIAGGMSFLMALLAGLLVTLVVERLLPDLTVSYEDTPRLVASLLVAFVMSYVIGGALYGRTLDRMERKAAILPPVGKPGATPVSGEPVA